MAAFGSKPQTEYAKGEKRTKEMFDFEWICNSVAVVMPHICNVYWLVGFIIFHVDVMKSAEKNGNSRFRSIVFISMLYVIRPFSFHMCKMRIIIIIIIIDWIRARAD